MPHRFKRVGPNAMRGRGIGAARGRATIQRGKRDPGSTCPRRGASSCESESGSADTNRSHGKAGHDEDQPGCASLVVWRGVGRGAWWLRRKRWVIMVHAAVQQRAAKGIRRVVRVVPRGHIGAVDRDDIRKCLLISNTLTVAVTGLRQLVVEARAAIDIQNPATGVAISQAQWDSKSPWHPSR